MAHAKTGDQSDLIHARHAKKCHITNLVVMMSHNMPGCNNFM